MTAHAMKGDRERCLEAGMDGYVAKPIRAKELFDTMQQVIPSPDDRDPDRHSPTASTGSERRH